MKFKELFRHEIANKCIYDEDKSVRMLCDRCTLNDVCEKICEYAEDRDGRDINGI